MIRFASLAAALLVAAPAFAQDPPEPPADAPPLDEAPPEAPAPAAPAPTGAGLDVAGSLTLLSDYRFRGVSRSDEDPAVQGSLSLSHVSGFYAGATATSLKGTDGFRLRDPAFRDLGDVELDLYAGYSTPIGRGFSLDGGLVYYAFLGGDGATDYAEPYASLTYLIGPLDVTAGAKYAPSQDAIGDQDMLYLFAQADVTIPFRPWRFTALVAHQDWSRFGDYWTWSLGAEHRLRLGRGADATLGLRYVDTDLPSRPGQDAALVATLGFNF